MPNPAEEHSEGNAMDPMSDWAGEETAMTQLIPGNKPAPLSPAPVQRQIAGSGGALRCQVVEQQPRRHHFQPLKSRL